MLVDLQQSLIDYFQAKMSPALSSLQVRSGPAPEDIVSDKVIIYIELISALENTQLKGVGETRRQDQSNRPLVLDDGGLRGPIVNLRRRLVMDNHRRLR